MRRSLKRLAIYNAFENDDKNAEAQSFRTGINRNSMREIRNGTYGKFSDFYRVEDLVEKLGGEWIPPKILNSKGDEM